MKTNISLLLAFIAHLIAPQFATAQQDTEFWFVAPKTWGHHRPDPTIFKIASGNATTTVRIERPADPGNGWSDIAFTIPANSIQHVQIAADLLFPINLNDPNYYADSIPDQVSNYGIHITSDAEITVYYESSYGHNNPDIYALKGRNALGTDFVTPFQSTWDNVLPSTWDSFNPGDDTFVGDPKSGFDIVATENNTVVTVIPTAPVVKSMGGVYLPGDTIRFVLDRGQTYRVKAASRFADKHLGGTVVSASKPIAVTTWDDSVHVNWCQDVIGDQIVPTAFLGNNYVVMKTLAADETTVPAPSFDHIIVQPIADNTQITITEEGQPSVTLTRNVNEPWSFIINEPSAFVDTDRPVYVYHIGGHGCEVGGAILPSVDNCTGSRDISFVRSPAGNPDPNNHTLVLNLVVRAGGESDFQVFGVEPGFTLGTFTDVPGTGGEWRYMSKEYPQTEIGVDQNIRVINSTSFFQLGVINADDWDGGAKYGYFSSFSNLDISTNDYLCTDAAADIMANGTAESYEWSNGSTAATFTATQAGTYTVTATIFNGCSIIDSVVVDIGNDGNLDLGSDFVLCEGTHVLDASESGFDNYVWSTGASSSNITIADSGIYTVTVTGPDICGKQGSIKVAQVNRPTLRDTSICEGASVILNTGTADTYSWGNGSSDQQITVANDGGYSVTVTSAGCTYSSQMTLVVNTLPSLPLMDAEICSNQSHFLELVGYETYRWSTGQSTNAIEMTAGGIYAVTTTDSIGCLRDGAMELTPHLLPNPVFADFDTCFAGGSNLGTSINYAGYVWNNGSSSSQVLITQPGLYSVTVMDANGCSNSVDRNILLRTPISIDNAVTCLGNFAEITATSGNTYNWSTGESTQTIFIRTLGNYSVTVAEDGCSSEAQFTVNIAADPGIVLPDGITCDGAIYTAIAPLSAAYLWEDGSTDPTLEVSTAGTYGLTITNDEGCPATGEFNLNLFNNPTPSFTALDRCATEESVLALTTSYENYAWNNGSTTANITIPSNGTFSVTVEDDNGCLGQARLDVEPLPIPVMSLNVTNAVRCSGDDIAVSLMIGDLLTFGPIDVYLDINGQDSMFSQLTTGTFDIAVQDPSMSTELLIDSVVLSNGCALDQSVLRLETVTATLADAPVITITPSGVDCISGEGKAQVDVELTQGVLPWRFSYDSSGVIVQSPEISSTGYRLNNLSYGTYSVVAGTDGNSCPVEAPDLPFLIEIEQGPKIEATADIAASYSCDGPLFILNIEQGQVTWTIDGVDEFGPTVEVQMAVQETQEISYSIRDNGCQLDTSLTLTAPDQFIQQDWLNPQNVFTPNADALNDVFSPDDKRLFDSCLGIKVYNRWGSLIFESSADEADWTGESFMGAAPEGTYFAILEIDGIGQISRSISLFR